MVQLKRVLANYIKHYKPSNAKIENHLKLEDVMKQKLAILLFTPIILSGCSTIVENSLETGNGSIELLTPTITTKDNELEIKTEGIDENKEW